MSPSALYIHLPFCKQKCNYCDFVSYAGKEELINDYVEALVKEIEGQRHQGTKGVKTVFFGGGTPTLLDPNHFDKIISTLICHLSLDIGHSEISVEANPGTADRAKLKELRSLGINRLSIGVQSFHDRHLKTLGRIHDSKTAEVFYDDARAAGFDNINLDLIFALPDQYLNEWKKDIQQAIAMRPDHLSIYNLQIEEGTPFHQQQTTNNLQLPTEEIELAMYEYAIDCLWLTGYQHYEISNFSKPGKECRHNINYWQMGNWLGFGAGAHTHLNGKRWANPNCLETYLKGTKTEPDKIIGDQGETLFMGLRLLEGLPAEKFHGFEKEVAELINDGLLKEDQGNYKLTKQGLYLANLVFEKFV
ncbi:MAG: radical SAM family heme chaperone HemW [Candidatus Margulisbacteria bacterium]|nr:radical SAM family heme chaperone HemW [Candidatus Margulisiibacteriota bacterium]